MKKIVSLVLALVLVMSLAVTASANAVSDARSGVAYIEVGKAMTVHNGVKVSGDAFLPEWSGSAFFVGEEGKDPTHLVTCYHVVETFDWLGNGNLQEGYKITINGDWAEKQAGIRIGGIDFKDGDTIDFRAQVRVYFSDDPGDYKEIYSVIYDENADLAIMKLAEPTSKRKPLKLMVPTNEIFGNDVYALGYPGISDNKYTETVAKKSVDAVKNTKGALNKIFIESSLGCEQLELDCDLQNGNSGGPIVTADGHVIGVARMVYTEAILADQDGNKCTNDKATVEINSINYASSVSELLELLDDKRIAYEMADGTSSVPTEAAPAETAPAEPAPTEAAPTEPAPTEAAVDTMALEEMLEEAAGLTADDYKDFSEVKAAVKDAKKALDGTQADVDAALEELENAMDALETKTNYMPIIIGAIAVLLVVVVMVVVMGGKKKGAKQSAPSAPPVIANPPVEEVGGTEILNPGTEILVNGGTLLKIKDNKRITINALNFVLGRNPAKCTYTITGNKAVSGEHAKLVVRGDKTYLVDLGSSNGTKLNGSQVNAKEEYELKNGDRIHLADEEFEYQK